jgi:nucleotide-binding universal stress UspA family protein
MMLTVVCPLADSPNAERALPSAYDAAAALGVSLELFSAVEDEHMVDRRQCHLEQAGTQTGGVGTDTPRVRVIVDPHAPRALAGRSASAEVLMVMATSSQPLMHTGYVGSAAERVVRESYHPVVLIGPHNQTRLGDVNRVVIACDGSALSEEIVPDACDWAERLSAEVWVVTMLDARHKGLANATPQTEANYVRRIASRINANWEVLHGHDPARTITDWAGPNALIALTSHGRSGFSRITVGSVATAVTRWATGPVLVGNQQKRLVEPPTA